MSEIVKFTDAVKRELEIATRQVLIASGVDKNSDLVKSVEYEEGKEGTFTLLVNDYLQYVSSGRRPKARKIPIQSLIKFIKDNNIRPRAGQSINQLAFAIQTSIFKSGIKGKNNIDKLEQTAFDVYEENIMNALEVNVLDAMVNAFKN